MADPQTLSLATWNINSVRLRLGLVEHFLDTHAPDVLCLQETKCTNAQFPTAAFEKRGYHHHVIHGQKGYHGVATLSRVPLSDDYCIDYCSQGDTRHAFARFAFAGRQIGVHNFYVPSGGDEPDPNVNPKFAHKLAFLDEMAERLPGYASEDTILVGDFNVAPYEHDVWSHKQLLKVVSHTPVETDRLHALRDAGPWHDVARGVVPLEEKLYSWWSYRSRDWSASDRGRRLDHIWTSPSLTPAVSGCTVLREARGWEKPSDHVPVILTLTA